MFWIVPDRVPLPGNTISILYGADEKVPLIEIVQPAPALLQVGLIELPDETDPLPASAPVIVAEAPLYIKMTTLILEASILTPIAISSGPEEKEGSQV